MPEHQEGAAGGPEPRAGQEPAQTEEAGPIESGATAKSWRERFGAAEVARADAVRDKFRAFFNEKPFLVQVAITEKAMAFLKHLVETYGEPEKGGCVLCHAIAFSTIDEELRPITRIDFEGDDSVEKFVDCLIAEYPAEPQP